MSSLRVNRKNVSVVMAMITPEGVNDTRMGLNTFHMTKKLCRSDFLHMQSASVWWLSKFHCCCHNNIRCVQNSMVLTPELIDAGMASTEVL